jgi:hypothetical protein
MLNLCSLRFIIIPYKPIHKWITRGIKIDQGESSGFQADNAEVCYFDSKNRHHCQTLPGKAAQVTIVETDDA